MTTLEPSELVQYPNDPNYYVRCPNHRGWTILQNTQINPDGSIAGHLHCEHPGCGFDGDVTILPQSLETSPEGGTVNVGIAEVVESQDVGPGGA